MENSNLLYDAWINERQLFEKNLGHIKKTVTKKAVHDIRVCIKKMKAYRNLFYVLVEHESKIKFKQTTKLFDVLGKLRNIHICLKLLTDYEKENKNNYTSLKDFLNGKTKQAKSWSKQTIKAYDDKELIEFESLLVSMQPDNQEKTIESEINSILNDLEDLAYEPHQMRRLLKKTYYWIKTLPGEQAEHVYKIEKLNSTTDNLGTWQDHEILLNEIKYFRKEFLPGSFGEKRELKDLQKSIKERKDNLVKEPLNDPDFIKK